jgi:hypothetical protein
MKACIKNPGQNLLLTAFCLFLFCSCENPLKDGAFTVTFDTHGGSAIAAQTVASGTAVNAPTAPTRSGFVFGDWWTAAEGGSAISWPLTVNANTTVHAKWGMAGTGAQDDPYILTDAAGLADMASGLSKYYKLVDNIEITGAWAAVGGQDSYFTGTLDGNGKTITFSGSVTPNGIYAGLFGFIYNGGTVKNLNLAGTLTVSVSSGNISVGALAGNNYGTISNVKSTVTVSASTAGTGSMDEPATVAFAGGIVGSNVGPITNCYATGAVSASTTGGFAVAYAGGIAGLTDEAVSNCYATGAVSATANTIAFAGGIAGSISHTVLQNVALNSSISATATGGTVHIGRIAGQDSTGIISNNFAISTMTVNGETVSDGALNSTNGAQFTNSAVGAWTAATDTGPGWTIADSQGNANETNPWWWDSDHPALYWE